MRFDPESGKLVCDFCGTSIEIPTDEAAEEAGAKDEKRPGIGEELPIYNCDSCGAEIVADAVTASVTCPYCGNNIVLTEKVTGGLRPDGIIPFKIDKKSLPDAVNAFYKGKRLLPKNFFSESSIENVCGVYVPFWLYDCTMQGDVSYDGYKDAAVREGDYLVTTRSHYNVVRDAKLQFKDIPVDGSARLDDALMDSLEPFDFSKLVPFNMSYLAGFFAERFDKDSDEVRQRADERIMTSALYMVDSKASSGYTGVERKANGLTASPMTSKYVLLPVYTFDVNWKGQKFTFAMNGESGKVVGEIPTDKGKVLRLRWLSFAAAAALIVLIMHFLSC